MESTAWRRTSESTKSRMRILILISWGLSLLVIYKGRNSVNNFCSILSYCVICSFLLNKSRFVSLAVSYHVLSVFSPNNTGSIAIFSSRLPLYSQNRSTGESAHLPFAEILCSLWYTSLWKHTKYGRVSHMNVEELKARLRRGTAWSCMI